MKKFYLLFCFALLTAMSLCAQQTVMVQGVPRQLKAPIAKRVTAQDGGDAFEASKVRYYVGEGPNTSYLIVEWCDRKGAEKLVWGYRYSEANGEKMLKDIAAADPRFYILVQDGTQYGSAIGGMGFDLNGNNVLGLEAEDGTKMEVNDNGLVNTDGYSFDGITPTDPTDHWYSGWYNGYWSYWVASSPTEDVAYSGVGATGRQLSDGSVDYWCVSRFGGDDDSAPFAPYYFYLPAPDYGVAIPEKLTFNMADSCYVPEVLTAKGTKRKSLYWWIHDENGKRDNSVIAKVTNDTTNVNGLVTFTGKTGTAKIVAQANIDGKLYRSDTCLVTVLAPQKPLTAISFENPTMTIGLKKDTVNRARVKPADATFTQLTYTSSDPSVASVNQLTGVVTSTTKEGTATITATSSYDPQLTAQYTVEVKCLKPVERIQPSCGDTLTIELRDIVQKPEVEVIPADADFSAVSYKIENPAIASFYQNNIVAHKIGETQLIIEASDGQGAKDTVTVKVVEPNRTPYEGYQDGTFLLNEAWFGHENADMNFLTADDSLMYRVYERENPGEAFGATASSATIYGGRMYVVSKQQADGGDETTHAGGRLVVLDAKTLKKIAGFDEICGGDGRSVVGVNPHKVYLGTTAGVVTFDVDNMAIGHIIDGTQGKTLYQGQIGDMVKAGPYVFAAQQNKGTLVIDAVADTVVTTIANDKIQGVAQDYEGMVWLASEDSLHRIDPATCQIKEKLKLPQGVNISCSWGAWRPVAFCASRTKNVLYWHKSGGMMGGGSDYYRYEIGTDISNLKPFFSLDTLKAAKESEKQIMYGSPRIDDRTNRLIVMATQSGWGANYEHNWLHLVDGTTGELQKTFKLKQYYWFQELPVFPDKYAPEFNGVNGYVTLEKGGQPYTADLAGSVSDRDNIAYNISIALSDSGDANVADVTLDGTTLAIQPVGAGTTKAILTAESNGITTEQEIYITVNMPDAIGQTIDGRAIKAAGGRLTVNGYAGWAFTLYSASGMAVADFTATTNSHTATPAVPSGAYILKGCCGSEAVTVKVKL
ncbi:MAG TPA: DUF5074 domain-containing protein [Candidatus Prevotella intestinigallinarum]|nr:DUF5074 domain-containing protein [Candidatus Prevotella intestinigallinarum]